MDREKEKVRERINEGATELTNETRERKSERV